MADLSEWAAYVALIPNAEGPQGLAPEEQAFVDSLLAWWQATLAKEPYLEMIQRAQGKAIAEARRKAYKRPRLSRVTEPLEDAVERSGHANPGNGGAAHPPKKARQC